MYASTPEDALWVRDHPHKCDARQIAENSMSGITVMRVTLFVLWEWL